MFQNKKAFTLSGLLISIIIFCLLVTGALMIVSSSNTEYNQVNTTFLKQFNETTTTVQPLVEELANTTQNDVTILTPIAFFTQGAWTAVKLMWKLPDILKNLLYTSMSLFSDEWHIPLIIPALLLCIVVVAIVAVLISAIFRYPI